MAASPSFNELFDPDFLEALASFALRARRVERCGRYAEQPSRSRGFGLEFADYKAYVPGDDLRSVDWNVYRRLGRLFVRVFEERQDLPVYLLIDRSKSMYLEQPPRIAAGLKAALALAAIALGQQDRAGLFSFSGAGELEAELKPLSGKGWLMTFARQLAGLGEAGETDLADALHRFAGQPLRPGLLVVVSDFFDPAGSEAVTAALGRSRHRLLLVQLVKKADADPADLRGDLRLRDCETGAAVDLAVTPAILARYREIYQAFAERLAAFARQRGAGLLRLDADRSALEQLEALFVNGRLLV